MLNILPKSSTQYAQAFDTLYKFIVDFVQEHKHEFGRGFVYNEYPSEELAYISLFEIQSQGSELIGIDPDLYSQLLDLIGTYNFATECVWVIRTEDSEQRRFIIQTAALDKTASEGIISVDEIKAQEAEKLRRAAALRLLELRTKRHSKKKGKSKK